MISRTALILTLALAGCGREAEPADLDGFGLPVIAIRMDGDTLSRMNGEVFDKAGYPAAVAVDGKEHKADVSYAGKTSIDAYKKNLNIDFEDGFLFKGMRKIRLSATTSDESALRTYLGYRVFALAGLPVPTLEPVAVYLNGRYLGLYALVEPLDEAFFQRRDTPAQAIFQARHSDQELDLRLLRTLPVAFKIKTEPEYFGDLERLVSVINGDEVSDPEALGTVLRLETLYPYVAASVVLNHWDGFNNNYHLYRRKDETAFSLAPWDLDATLQPNHDVALLGAGRICARVLGQEVFAAAYLDVLRGVLAAVDEQDVSAWLAAHVALMREAYAHDRVLSASGKTLDEQAAAVSDALDARTSTLAAALR